MTAELPLWAILFWFLPAVLGALMGFYLAYLTMKYSIDLIYKPLTGPAWRIRRKVR